MQKPLIIAHRGGRKERPENTIKAFKHAIELGADAIELDVLLTKDLTPIVTHNDSLRDIPLASIKEIPTLEEALTFIGQHNIGLIVEIKKQKGLEARVASIVGEIVKKTNFKGNVIISSFDPRILFHLKRSFPEIPRAMILKSKAFSFFCLNFFARFNRLSEVHVLHKIVTKKLVDKVHSQGLKISVWTVNDLGNLKRFIDIEVDGIITDDLNIRGDQWQTNKS